MRPSNLYFIVAFSLVFFNLVVIWPLLQKDSLADQLVKLDLIAKTQDPENVRGKKVLFIGDSHTSAYGWGWQDMICQRTGMHLKNTASVGKQTNWMAEKLKKHADTSYDYCFIYGGGNDIAAGVGSRKVFSNISTMVSYCQELNITPVVITGANPSVVIDPVSNQWKLYIKNKSILQNFLLDSLQGAYVIDIRDIIEKKDCADFLCHMKKSGHSKISNRVIKTMNFQEIYK